MKTAGRYEIREVLGEGGMGVVYRAFDPVTNREVTLKTIRNPQDKTALDLFRRECSVLASMGHPNIVEIFDIGEADEPGGKRPYFVMPLLRGTTLDKLLKTSSARLTTERSIHIISQICRGLQSAHEQGLVHRDLKPSNLFILDDDSVKIIDFGVAHLIDQHTASGLKGTLLYMAPEQLQMKPPTPLSDQFSIAAVCYEALARRHPFSVPGYKDLTQAILNHTPAPICDLNQAVSRAVSQVVHKALAKEPVHRFSDVREFGESLQKAFRNEPIAVFDPAKLEPRLERARRAFADGDLEFAGEVVRELESESYLHPEIVRLRQEIEQTQHRKTVAQLLATARHRFEEEEYLLALQKVQEILNIDPSNTDAFTLKAAIENQRSIAQMEGTLRLAQQHLENRAYDLARKAAEKVLQLRPKDPRAEAVIAEADRREQESARVRQDKEKAYQAAMDAFGHGDLSAALTKLERVLDLERRWPEITNPEQSASYQKLYEEVRSKRDHLETQYSEAQRLKADGNLPAALAVCEEVLRNYPGNVVFQSLQYDIEEAGREEISAYIAKVERDVAAEPDMSRKVAILEAARERYPSEERFTRALDRVKARRDLVRGIAGRATALEDAGQFAEALAQWEILRQTYPQYPGLDVEIERLKHRRELQVRTEAKAHWVEQIDEMLALNNFARADALADDALAEFNADPELLALKRSAQLGLSRGDEARRKLAEASQLIASGEHERGFATLREAARLDPQSQDARRALVDALLQRARALFDTDWRAAEPLVAEVLEIDPGNPLAKSLGILIRERSQSEEVTSALSKARDLKAQGDIRSAIAHLDRALQQYPGQDRLTQLRASLVGALPPAERSDMRMADLQQVEQLVEQSKKAKDTDELESIFAQTRVYTSKYEGDRDFMDPVTVLEDRVRKTAPIVVPPSPPPAPVDRAQAAGGGFAAWLRTTKGRVALAGAALAGALVLLFGAGGGGSSGGPKAEDSALARVVLNGAPGSARILDSKREDVTVRQAGLPAGDYVLVLSKAGFRNQEVSFRLSPGQTYSPPDNVNWVPVPPTLSIRSDAGGEWKLDGQLLTPEEMTNKTLPAEGEHELVWSQRNVELKLPLIVSAGFVELGKWSPSRVTALAVSVKPGGAALRLSNLKVKYQAGVDNPVEATSDSEVPWPASGFVNVQVREGVPVENFVRAEPSEGGRVFVWLPGAPRRTTASAKPEPAPAQPPPAPAPVAQEKPPEPPKPQLTPEQLREQRLRELGLPSDITKKGSK